MRAVRSCTFFIIFPLILVLFLIQFAGATPQTVAMMGQAREAFLSKAVPEYLSYQGFLADAADSSAVTATLEMTFRLFDSETKGAELWSEIHPAVEVQGGLFQVQLGSVTPFPAGLFDGTPLWLQTEVNTEVLTPRKLLVSAAYSQRAEKADYATSAELSADAQHAVHADTADYCPGISAWILSGDDVYRQAGSVGIGTSSPAYPLDVNGAINAATYYGDGSNLTGIAGTTDGDWTISGSDQYSAVSGRVGIGTSSPEAKLHVDDDTGIDALYVRSADTTAIVGVSGDSTGPTYAGYFECDSHQGGGLYVVSERGYGVFAMHTHQSFTAPAINGYNSGSGAGVSGRGLQDQGIYGSSRYGEGVYAYNTTKDIYAYLADTVWAGYFSGDVHVDGLVGIGATNPVSNLEVEDVNPDMRLDADVGGAAYLRFSQDDDQKATVKMTPGGDLQLDTEASGAAGLTILNSNAYVGVGTETPARTLHVGDAMRLEPTSAPSSPQEGDMYMDSTTHKLMVYDGTVWQACW